MPPGIEFSWLLNEWFEQNYLFAEVSPLSLEVVSGKGWQEMRNMKCQTPAPSENKVFARNARRLKRQESIIIERCDGKKMFSPLERREYTNLLGGTLLFLAPAFVCNYIPESAAQRLSGIWYARLWSECRVESNKLKCHASHARHRIIEGVEYSINHIIYSNFESASGSPSLLSRVSGCRKKKASFQALERTVWYKAALEGSKSFKIDML